MPFFFFLNYWCLIFDSCSYSIDFNPIIEFVIPIGIQTKETKAEKETHPVTAEAKIRKC